MATEAINLLKKIKYFKGSAAVPESSKMDTPVARAITCLCKVHPQCPGGQPGRQRDVEEIACRSSLLNLQTDSQPVVDDGQSPISPLSFFPLTFPQILSCHQPLPNTKVFYPIYSLQNTNKIHPKEQHKPNPKRVHSATIKSPGAALLSVFQSQQPCSLFFFILRRAHQETLAQGEEQGDHTRV